MPSQHPSVLLADPDVARLRAGTAALRAAGLTAAGAAHQTAAERLLGLHHPVLAIVDTGLPPSGGLEAVRALRRIAEVAFIVLTHEREPASRVAYLAAGADDVVEQPAAPEEMAARARAVLRRLTAAPHMTERLSHRELALEPRGAMLWRGDQTARLTPDQSALMRVFMEFPGRVFSRAELAARLGAQSDGRASDEAIDGQIRSLRRKIEPDASHPSYLVSVRGFGYMLAREERVSPRGCELELLRAALGEVPTTVVLVDRERRLLFLNRAAEDLAGCPAEMVTGKETCARLFRCRYPEGKALTARTCPGMATLRGADGTAVPLRVRTATGEHHVVSTHRALHAGGQEFMLVAFQPTVETCCSTS